MIHDKVLCIQGVGDAIGIYFISQGLSTHLTETWIVVAIIALQQKESGLGCASKTALRDWHLICLKLGGADHDSENFDPKHGAPANFRQIRCLHPELLHLYRAN